MKLTISPLTFIEKKKEILFITALVSSQHYSYAWIGVSQNNGCYNSKSIERQADQKFSFFNKFIIILE